MTTKIIDIAAATEAAISVAAPGKIILSGEHAVVYGNPALAMAVSQFCQVTFSPTSRSQSEVLFDFADFGYQRIFTLNELMMIRDKHKSRESHSATGIHLDLLAVYAFVMFAEKLSLFLEPRIFGGLKVKIKSSIPIGSGMGSSAALIVALGKALLGYVSQNHMLKKNVNYQQEYQQEKLDAVTFLSWAKQIEDLQHGKSSGLDLHLAYYGGTACFKECKIEPYASFSPLFSSFYLVNTGKPITSTRECVQHAKKYLADNPKLLDDFAAVTYALDAVLRARNADKYHNSKEVSRCICENHQLLCGIKVVPDKVKSFIAELAKLGMAGKISGAGAITGDCAGMVLVFCEDGDAGVNSLAELSAKYNYQILSIGEEQHGARSI